MADTEHHAPGQHPDLSPPITTVGLVGWVRQNLLSSPLNIALTVVALFLVYITVPPLINWAFVTSVWSGETRQTCDMGRQLARMGVTLARIDPMRLKDPAMETPIQHTQDFLGQFVSTVGAKKAELPDSLRRLLSKIDVKAIKGNLAASFKKGDGAAIQRDLAQLTPLVEWGAARDGACWTFIKVWLKQIMYGRYPDDKLWRINLGLLILVVSAIPLFLERVKVKRWIGAYLIIVYPFIALYLFSGFTAAAVEAWPYRFMGFAALGLAIAAVLPITGALRKHSALVSLVLLVLVPLWGLSAPATWTTGLIYGGPMWSVVLAFLLAVVPPVALVAGPYLPSLRDVVRAKFWQLAVAAAVLAFIGYALPLLFWNPIAGPTPPWVMAVAPAALGLAALAPWGYGAEAGGAGRFARVLLPVYLVIAYLVLVGPPDFLNFAVLDWTANTTPMFRGFQAALPYVETPLWGGLFLTLVISGVGIVTSLPIGVVLALGRRSNMPVVRSASVAFIELWRGVPLISVLFMASVMFPLFLPEGVNFDKLVRALAGVALFSSAYMAEVVRGGLQAIPKGQYEAAEAMGLTYWKSMNLVILPQALKLVIPGIVNTFIGLFKDTTLVLIIGLFDLLGAVQQAAQNQRWLGFSVEGYVFAALGFWIFCFGMSRYSIFVEKKLETGHKR